MQATEESKAWALDAVAFTRIRCKQTDRKQRTCAHKMQFLCTTTLFTCWHDEDIRDLAMATAR